MEPAKVLVNKKNNNEYFVKVLSLDISKCEIMETCKGLHDLDNYTTTLDSGSRKIKEMEVSVKGLTLAASYETGEYPCPSSEHKLTAIYRGQRLGWWYIRTSPRNLGCGWEEVVEKVYEALQNTVGRYIWVNNLDGVQVVVDFPTILKEWGDLLKNGHCNSPKGAILGAMASAKNFLEGDTRELLQGLPQKIKDDMLKVLEGDLDDLAYALHRSKSEDEFDGSKEQLKLILSDGLEEALQPLPSKEVPWEVVRNIANDLTNGAKDDVDGGIDIKQAHMSSFSEGPCRDWVLEKTGEGAWRESIFFSKGEGWAAFDEDDVCELSWESLTSESGLIAKKVEKGRWNLTFQPSRKNPLYRGYYYEIYENPADVKGFE